MKPETDEEIEASVRAYRAPIRERYFAQLEAGTATAERWIPEDQFETEPVPYWLKVEAIDHYVRRGAKTTKKKTTITDETTVIEPDDVDDGDDDDDDDQDEAVAAVAAAIGSRGGIAAEIESVADRAGLSGDARSKFVAEAMRDQERAGGAPARRSSAEVVRVADAFHLTGASRKALLAQSARPSTASAQVPSMTISMTVEDMAPQRTATTHRAPAADEPPPPKIALTGWRDRA